MGIFLSVTFFLILLLLLYSSSRVQLYIFGKVLSRPLLEEDRLVFVGLCSILLLGFILRLVLTWNRNLSSPERLTADEPGYDTLARDLLKGYGFTWPGRVPLYPAWIVLVYLVSNGSIPAVRWAQIFWGVVVILLVFALTRRIFGPQAGLLAAILASLSYVLFQQSLRLLSESLYTPVLLLAVIALWDAGRRPGVWLFCLVGVLIGISNLIRPTLFLYPVFLGVILVFFYKNWRGWIYAAAIILASSLVIAPWMIRNYTRYTAVYPLATSNAILWQGSPEYYHLVRDKGYSYLDVWEKVIYGPLGQSHDPGSIEGDRWWTRRALRSIAEEPLVYFYFSLEKLATYWIGDPNADWGDTYVFNYQALRKWGFSHVESIQLMIARALPILGFATAILLVKMWRLLLPIYALLAYSTLLHALTHAEARLSEPLQPYLLILIVGAGFKLFADIGFDFKGISSEADLQDTLFE